MTFKPPQDPSGSGAGDHPGLEGRGLYCHETWKPAASPGAERGSPRPRALLSGSSSPRASAPGPAPPAAPRPGTGSALAQPRRAGRRLPRAAWQGPGRAGPGTPPGHKAAAGAVDPAERAGGGRGCSLSRAPWAAPAAPRRRARTAASPRPRRPAPTGCSRVVSGPGGSCPGRAGGGNGGCPAAGAGAGAGPAGRAQRCCQPSLERLPGQVPHGAGGCLPASPGAGLSRQGCWEKEPREEQPPPGYTDPATAAGLLRLLSRTRKRRRGENPLFVPRKL